MADYTLSVKVIGDAARFIKSMAECENKMKKVSGNISSVGSKLTSKITKPALVAGGALAGMTLAKGWSRMTAIDNAKVKLEALGNTGPQVEKIMNNALASVQKTAYGMDAAATTAASAVAAGIKPGEELTRYLSLTADAAAVAGISMDEMGSIMNKVTTNGKMSAEEMNQLADRGIPVMSLLSKATGKSMDEVREDISSGKISIKELQDAIEQGFGGAAQEIGSKTITGAISNIGASVSRIGANFLGSADDANSFAGQVLPMLNDFTDYLGGLEEKAGTYGATFGEVFGGIVTYFKEGKTNMEGMSESAQNIMTSIQPLLTIVKTLGTWFMDLGPKGQMAVAGFVLGIGPALSLAGGLVGVIGKLSGMFGVLKGGAEAMGSMGGAAKTAGAATGGLSTKLFQVGAAVLMIGGGVLIAAVGFKIMASAATTLASAGGAATAIFFGMIAAFAGLIVVAGALGPASLAAGAAILMLGAGLALAGAGALMLGKGILSAAKALPIVGKSGKSAATGIKQIGKAASGLKLGSLLKLGGLALEFKSLGKSTSKVASSFRTIANSSKTATNGLSGMKKGLSQMSNNASSSAKSATKSIDSVKKSAEALGKVKPKVSIGVSHVPHFSVSWTKHSKGGTSAYTPNISYWAKGAIFNGASLLPGGNVVGEAGPEAVAPIATLQRYVADAVHSAFAAASAVYNYYFGDIIMDASNLEDVATIEDVVNIFRRAKAFA